MASYLGNLSPTSQRSQDVRPSTPGGLFIPAGGGAYGRLGTMPTQQVDISFGRDLSLEEAVKRLQEIMGENQELKTTLRDNNGMMKSLQKVLLEMKTNWDSERAEFVQKYEQAKTVVTALRKDVETKKELIVSLEHHSGQLEPSKSKDEVDSMQNELALYRSNLDQLTKDKELKNTEIETLKIKIDQVQKKYDEQTAELKNKESQIKSTTEECESLQNKMSRLVQHNNKITESSQKEKKELASTNSDLQLQLDRLKLSITTNYGPNSLAAMMKDSLVLGEGSEGSKESSLEKQTHQKYLFSAELTQDQDHESEKRSLAKYESEMWGEKMEKYDLPEVLRQLKTEQRKVADLEAKMRDINSELVLRSQELAVKDESLTHLRLSLDDQVKRLQTEHAVREEQMMREIDNMQRHLQHSKSSQSESQMESVSNMKAQVISLLHEVHESNRRLEISNGQARRYQQKCEEVGQQYRQVQEELESQRSKDDHLIEALRGTVASTESYLATQKELNDKKGSVIEENNIEIQDLKKECSTLKYQIDQLKRKQMTQNPYPSNGQTVTLTLAQKREQDEKVDRMTAELLSVEDALLAKQEEIQKLQQKVILLRTETEDIPYLRAQAQSYKTDFEIQQKACSALQKEKMHLQEEIENSRLFNSQLRDQLDQLSSMHRRGNVQRSTSWDRMRGRPYPGGGYDECDQGLDQAGTLVPDTSPARVPTEHSSSKTSPNPPTLSLSQSRNQYQCPKCGLTAPDMDSMTIHIDECVRDT